MILLALLVLITDGVVDVPPSRWTAIQLKTDQNSTTAQISYDVERGSRVQALVLTRQDAELFNRGRQPKPIGFSGFERSARFRVFIPEAGDYVLLLDNRIEGRFPSKVRLRIEVSAPNDVRVSWVPEERRRATVALSLLFFGSVVVFSAVKFLRS